MAAGKISRVNKRPPRSTRLRNPSKESLAWQDVPIDVEIHGIYAIHQSLCHVATKIEKQNI